MAGRGQRTLVLFLFLVGGALVGSIVGQAMGGALGGIFTRKSEAALNPTTLDLVVLTITFGIKVILNLGTVLGLLLGLLLYRFW